MIKVRSNNSLRYHVYHIITLFYPAAKIEYLDEKDLTAADIEVTVKEDELTVQFFGAVTVHPYPDRNLNVMRRELFRLLEKKTEKHLPWGILIGIRPSKIVRELIEKKKSKEEIVYLLQQEYLATPKKIELAYEVALKESELLKKVDTKKSVDIYVGMPFCPSRCIYCSFASNVYSGNKYKDTYLKLLKEEMNLIKSYIDENKFKINSVYFGGGTPTAVSDSEFEEVMQCIDDCFVNGRNLLEFTVEAGRVDSINEQKLMSMKNHHTSRISINPQTMNDDTLKLIGRNHDHEKVVEIFNLARSLGFDNINMDMILGLPEESLPDVERTIEGIRNLSPENITVHGLSVKRASRLYEDFLMEKKYALPSQDEMNLMYEKTDQMARSLGLRPYYMYRQKNMVGNLENVGYAKEGTENLYNMVMIEEIKTIIAVGADGVTKKVKDGKIERFANFKGLNDYTERFQEMMEKKLSFLKE